MKAVIVGAGIGGLTAGYRLHKKGWDVVVLEADSQIGGRTSTFKVGPYQLEKGATGLSTGYRRYMDLARELGLEDQIVPCSNKIMLMNHGRLYPIDGTKPLGALFTSALGLRSKWLLLKTILDFRKIRPVLDVLDVSASAAGVDFESGLEYAERRLNREVYDVLIDPMIRTYVINRGSNVSALEWFSSLANLAGQRLMIMKGGIGRLPAVLASHLDVRTSSPVQKVARVGGGVEVRLESGEVIGADACIVASKLFQTRQIVPEMEPVIGPLSDIMTYNRSVVVTLGYAKRVETDAMGVLVPTVEHSQIGLLWMEHGKGEEVAPAGHSLMTCYFEEGGIDEVQPDTDARYVEIAEAFITRLFPEVAGTRDMESVVRWKAAIPNPAPGVYRALHAMKQQLDVTSPIQLAGDYFTCTGQNSAIHWAEVAAANIDRHVGRSNASA